MDTSVVGFPRIGALRELKFAEERYWKGQKQEADLLKAAKELRRKHWLLQKNSGIDWIPANDFSLYDNMLDTAVMLNAVPERYRALRLDGLDEYFAMARGYQGEKGDVHALSMKKWFNTNYHYMVPELEDSAAITLNGTKVLSEFEEAKALGLRTKPVVVGPFTFLKLAKFTGKKTPADFAEPVAAAYAALLRELDRAGAQWVQLDEPSLVTDLTADEIALFEQLYRDILNAKGHVKVLCQTYFGDIRDCYEAVAGLDFDGIGLDFVEGDETLSFVTQKGFPDGKTLFAGVVNGKNIWRNHYEKTVQTVKILMKYTERIIIGTSCSLLHVPFTLENETKLDAGRKKHFAFAVEKLGELAELKSLLDSANPAEGPAYLANAALFRSPRLAADRAAGEQVNRLTEDDFIRKPDFARREKIQKAEFKLPLLPTTTIGSFPQTAEVRNNRAEYKRGEISEQAYVAANKKMIADCIRLQEDIGLDVLVHGEFERNDMVEYFGEQLDGFLFMEKAWVQSYGTRCVKPPVIWGDVARRQPMTVSYAVYAQSLTEKPVKGMLTGPVTILNWSFPREDVPLKESAYQIALAIREEVLDLEANGIRMIQIDEAALREKLPLRKADWHPKYLDWAIPAFRLVHSGVKPETQIHTHMCYSEFNDIIRDIDAMDADVITFEASRSDLTIIDALNRCGFRTEVGPGVYDIHSPRIPTEEEIEKALRTMLKKLPGEKLWVNPDCGLKTRGNAETEPSLRNMVRAAETIRKEL